MFQFRDVEIIAEVARTGGFRAAAESLSVAPSAISARIAQIEADLGIAMFDRSRRGARLTPSGRHFLERATRLIDMREQISSDLSASGGRTGTLRIGVAETIVHTFLPGLLRQLSQAAPKMRFELSVDISEYLSRALRDDEIDIAVVLRQWTPRGATAHPIGKVDLNWYAAPSLVAHMSETRSPNQKPGKTGTGSLKRPRRHLFDHAIITFSKASPPAQEVRKMLSDPALSQPIIHGSSSLATMVHLTRDGFGIGTLPDAMVRDEVRNGHLQKLDFGRRTKLSALEFDLCTLSPSIASLADMLHTR